MCTTTRSRHSCELLVVGAMLLPVGVLLAQGTMMGGDRMERRQMMQQMLDHLQVMESMPAK